MRLLNSFLTSARESNSLDNCKLAYQYMLTSHDQAFVVRPEFKDLYNAAMKCLDVWYQVYQSHHSGKKLEDFKTYFLSSVVEKEDSIDHMRALFFIASFMLKHEQAPEELKNLVPMRMAFPKFMPLEQQTLPGALVGMFSGFSTHSNPKVLHPTEPECHELSREARPYMNVEGSAAGDNVKGSAASNNIWSSLYDEGEQAIIKQVLDRYESENKAEAIMCNRRRF